MIKKILVFALIPVVLGSNFAFCAEKSPPKPEIPFSQELQGALENGLKVTNGMGVSAAVMIPGYKTWLGVSGRSDPAKSEDIRTDMVFNIASIAKNFIAALILKLAEQGKLTLEDPLNKWLSDFPNIDNTITIRQLLNHTSGVFDYVNHPRSIIQIGLDKVDLTKTWTPEEILKTMVDKPYFSPGEGWQYSSTNYILLNMIIEKATRSEVSAQLRKHFLNPLNLKSIFMDSEESLPAGFLIAHPWFDFNRDGSLDDISSKPRRAMSTLLHGSLYSTAEDLARWSQSLYQGEILSQSSLQQLLTFHPVSGQLYSGYGLGTEQIVLEGTELWGHLGEGLGYYAFTGYLPEHEVSLSVLINDYNEASIQFIGMSLLKTILGNLQLNKSAADFSN